jgi:hypothetical protein
LFRLLYLHNLIGHIKEAEGMDKLQGGGYARCLLISGHGDEEVSSEKRDERTPCEERRS